MKSNAKKKTHDFIYRGGKPVSVILDIKEYEEMLELLEYIEDLKHLEEMRKKPLKFRSLDEFLKERKIGV